MQNRDELFENTEIKVDVFLTDLAVKQNVAASTQNQAFNALVFLYKIVLERPLENMRATRTRIGDWEADCVIGKGHKGVFATLAERKSRFYLPLR